MTTALQSAEQHLAALAANGVPAKDKPSALHHGLITQLVAELRLSNLKLDGEEAIRRGYAERVEAAEKRVTDLGYDTLDALIASHQKNIARLDLLCGLVNEGEHEAVIDGLRDLGQLDAMVVAQEDLPDEQRSAAMNEASVGLSVIRRKNVELRGELNHLREIVRRLVEYADTYAYSDMLTALQPIIADARKVLGNG